MMKRNLLRVFISLFIGSVVAATSVSAQDLSEVYVATGEYELAKSMIEKQMSANPAQSNYLLGEMAYADGDLNKAKAFYEKGVAASADYVLNNVGLGKVLLKSNPKAAETEFSKAISQNKKNVDVIIAVAKAYYANGMQVELDKKIAEARKADRKSPAIYIFEGDRLTAAKDVGGAAGQYEQAVNFDPKNVVGYVKMAQVYMDNKNPDIPSDWLNRLLELRPDYVLAYKYLGKINYEAGYYKKAIDAYKTFFAGSEYSIEDLTYYAASLYFTEQYDEASAMIKEGVEKKPNDFVLNRLLMYTTLDTKNYEEGLSRAEKFFAIDKGDKKYIPRDYTTYARILIENDRFEEALPQYNLAVELDSTQVSVYREIAERLSSLGKHAEAGSYYEKYTELDKENATATDFFQMGRSFYTAAATLSKEVENPEAMERVKEYLGKADKAFGVVMERIPDKTLGPVYRARANALLDQESLQGLAKPYYERVLEILDATTEEATAANQRERLEAYNYLAYYNYVQYDEYKKSENKAEGIRCCNEVLSLDPNNTTAQQLLDELSK